MACGDKSVGQHEYPSFDSLSIVLADTGEVWIVRRDLLPGCDDPDDGLGAYPSPLSSEELPTSVYARGPGRPQPPISLYSNVPDNCTDPIACGIARRLLAGEYEEEEEDELVDQLSAANRVQRGATSELSLVEAERVLNRLQRARAAVTN